MQEIEMGLKGKKEMTVGTLIHMRHLAAAPLGAKVRAEARLREIDGQRLVFDVAAYDAFEKISEGINENFILSVDRSLDKVKKKETRRCFKNIK